MTAALSLLAAQGSWMGLSELLVLKISAVAFFGVVIYMMGLATVQLATGRYRLSLETHVMCTAVGLAVFAVMTVLLNTFGFRLTWWSYLLSACVLFIAGALRDILAKEISPEARAARRLWTKDTWFLIAALGMTVVMFLVFVHGAFVSQWLTNDDSWVHAVSAKHVSTRGTYSVGIDVRLRYGNRSYLEPYPPVYATLMGVLHQIMPSIYWTLKFFNALIVSLGVVYFYIMVRRWTSRPAKALWMTGMLWVLPCFMSNFVWAQSLALVMFFPAFWAFERARESSRWNVIAAIIVAAICITQPSSALIFVVMALIYCIVNLVFAARNPSQNGSVREMLLQGGAFVLGGLLSLIYYIPTYLKFGQEGFIIGLGGPQAGKLGGKVLGTGRGVGYGLWDFIWAPASTKINQPTGIGLVLFGVCIAGLVLLGVRWRRTRTSRRHVVVLIWLLLTVMGVLGEYLPFALFPHRFWAFMALPLAMIAGEFLNFLGEKLKGNYTVLAVSLGAVLGIMVTLVGLGEAIYALKPVPLEGVRLLVFILTAVASFVGAVTALYLLIQNVVDQRTWGAFVGVVFLVVGIALTSGFTKTRFQGFSLWDPGVGFYLKQVHYAAGPDGRAVLTHDECQNDLWGYVLLTQTLPKNYPVLGVTCTDGRIIGFDMFTPPFDEGVRKLRRDVSMLMDAAVQERELAAERLAEKGLSTEEAEGIREEAAARIAEIRKQVVARIHEVAVAGRFLRVTVDHGWVAEHMRWRLRTYMRRRRLLAEARITTVERLDELLQGNAAPTPIEQEYLESIRTTMNELSQAQSSEIRSAMKSDMLGNFLSTSPLFETIPIPAFSPDGTPQDISRFGIRLFKPKTTGEEVPVP